MKVAVGLSGGIDSATTALTLLEEGYEVMGVTMHVFDHQTKELEAAKRVAETLGIEHHILDYREDFKRDVIGAFKAAYEAGMTPNPCIFCNRKFKYKRLIEDSIKLGADKFSTGHYANIVYDEAADLYRIFRANSNRKDQSYNLYHLNQDILSRLIFPLGQVASKEEVRAKFSQVKLEISQKKDSLGICFIPRGTQAHFLKAMGSQAALPGYFVDSNGKLLGKHQGLCHYTIGQKRGLGTAQTGGLVVTEIVSETNEIRLGAEDDLLKTHLKLDHFSLLHPIDLVNPLRVSVKLSQWSTLYEGRLEHKEGYYWLSFESPVRAPAPGQAIVIYDGDELLGGGMITKDIY